MTGRAMPRKTMASVAAALAITVVTACSSTGSHPSGSPSSSATAEAGTATARVGDLTITGGYIPQQASPDVAAAYLTITNAGSVADTLSRVTTDVTREVMAMDETDQGTSGSMTDLPRVVVPAHGSFRFTQAHAHLMLQRPSHLLKQGEKVTMTITFAHAGTVHLVLPVVGFTGPDNGTAAPPMTGMPTTGASATGGDH